VEDDKAVEGKNSDLMRNILIESLSEDHIRIIDQLAEPKHDEDLAEELNIKATIIRTLLNELHSYNLVEYERTKNKRTGWYTYLWKRREDKIQEHIKNYLQQKLEALNQRLKEEQEGVKFNCSCRKVSYEEALNMGFICTECGEPFMEYDNTEEIDKLIEEIDTLKSLIEQT